MCSDDLRCSKMFSGVHWCYWMFSGCSVEVGLMFSGFVHNVYRMFSWCLYIKWKYCLLWSKRVWWSPSLWWSKGHFKYKYGLKWSKGIRWSPAGESNLEPLLDVLLSSKQCLMDCNLSFHGFQCRNLCSCIANRFLRQCWQFCWYLVTQSCIQGLLFELDSHSQFCALSSSAQVHRLFQFLQKSHSCEKKKSSFNFVGSFIPICALYDQLFNWTSACILCSFVDEFLLCFFDFLRENVKSLFQVIESVLNVSGLECRQKLQDANM